MLEPMPTMQAAQPSLSKQYKPKSNNSKSVDPETQLITAPQPLALLLFPFMLDSPTLGNPDLWIQKPN
jgi:hypothetical protein